jgi:hypothetical protein
MQQPVAKSGSSGFESPAARRLHRGIRGRAVNNLGLRLHIRCGFYALFFFVLAVTLQAAASSGALTVNGSTNPSPINFVSVVGGSQTQSVTLANSGGPKVTITQAIVSGTGFALSGLSLPLTLAGGQSVTCSVAFAPQTVTTASVARHK